MTGNDDRPRFAVPTRMGHVRFVKIWTPPRSCIKIEPYTRAQAFSTSRGVRNFSKVILSPDNNNNNNNSVR